MFLVLDTAPLFDLSLEPEGSVEFRNVLSQGGENRVRIQTFAESGLMNQGWFEQGRSIFRYRHSHGVPTYLRSQPSLLADVRPLGIRGVRRRSNGLGAGAGWRTKA